MKKKTFTLASNGKGHDTTGSVPVKGTDSLTRDAEPPSQNGSKEKKPAAQQVGLMQLFRYASSSDILLMVLGTLSSIASGMVMPMNSLVFGEMVGKFITGAQESASRTEMSGTMNSTHNITTFAPLPPVNIFAEVLDTYIIFFLILAAVSLVSSYFAITLWTIAAERQIHRIRGVLFQSVMDKSIGWFDVHDSVELSTNLVSYMASMSEGMGDKMATTIMGLTTFLGGFCIGMAKSWQLTLIIVAGVPVIALIFGGVGVTMKRFVARELQAYGKAGAVAEEALTAIRTVFAFGGQVKAVQKYSDNLVYARKEGTKRSALVGGGMFVFFCLTYSLFGIVFYVGYTLVEEGLFHAGIILTVIFAVLLGALALGNCFSNFESIGVSRTAAFWLYSIIDEKSGVENNVGGTAKFPKTLDGVLSLRDVHFVYPSRPEVEVLKGLSLDVCKGQTVALVGASGCGKSTVIQLLERFYDVTEGQVMIDGVDIKEYDLKSLRSYIGVVSQEPTLFATTIAQNIRMGAANVEEVSEDEITKAAKEANCYDFIMSLPEKFETLVGERGAHLSGGQKQRIAIARALVGNPRILLLDEATSALDTESEAIVQAALDKASEGRTTVIIAHRLSTIRGADVIFGLSDGVVEEQGTHEELMAKKGLYYGLHTQTPEDVEEKEDGDGELDGVPELSEGMIHLTVDQGRPRAMSNTSTVRSYQGADSHRSCSNSHNIHTITSSSHSQKTIPSESVPANYKETAPIIKIFAANRPESGYIVLGSLCAVLFGSFQPIFSVIMSEMLAVFIVTDGSGRASITMWVGVLVALGVGIGLVTFIQQLALGFSGEKLTERMRTLCFNKMLHQEMGWFDDSENQVGKLTAKLATEASLVKGASGVQLGVILQAIANLSAAFIIAFIYLWKLAFVAIALVPLAFVASIIEFRLQRGTTSQNASGLGEAASVASEAIVNIRTVAGLNKEKHFVDTYLSRLEPIYRATMKSSLLYGIAFSVSQATFPIIYAVCFAYGSYLIDNEGAAFYDVIRVFSAITFSGRAAGRALTNSPDFSKARVAAGSIFSLLGRKSEIDSLDPKGHKLERCEGSLTFCGVRFSYPTRPTMSVLRGLDLEVKVGEKLALVGSSGCGKSTIISLLERYYDPSLGEVKLDGHNLKELNLQDLRQHISIVSQEPSLFDTTIAENIAYGDNSRVVPTPEIIEAAKKANIHEFITGLPLGYETNAGERGTQLSGGQKQRIAIARAMVRKPQVLLLDEATSALDTENEKTVQEALTKALEGKTSITIAHRLSTVRGADRIAVIRKGRVVETGTHQALLEKKEYYYDLINSQVF